MSPQKLVEQLQEAGVEAAVSSVLPDDFLVATGLQHLIRQGLMQQGSCQANSHNPYMAVVSELLTKHHLVFAFTISFKCPRLLTRHHIGYKFTGLPFNASRLLQTHLMIAMYSRSLVMRS